MKNPIKMDDLEVPLFSETPIWICFNFTYLGFLFWCHEGLLQEWCNYISGSQHPSHFLHWAGLQTMAKPFTCWFVPYFTILYHENIWRSLVPPEKKLQDSHFLGLFGYFCGRFSNLRGVLHGFRLISHKTPPRFHNWKCIPWILWSFFGREIWFVGHRSGVSTITFWEKTKMLSKKLFFKESSIFPMYFLKKSWKIDQVQIQKIESKNIVIRSSTQQI